MTKRLQGQETTDFGTPAIAPSGAYRPMTAAERRRWTTLLEPWTSGMLTTTRKRL